MPLFGSPNIAKLAAKGDVKGLIKAGKARDPRTVEPLHCCSRGSKLECARGCR